MNFPQSSCSTAELTPPCYRGQLTNLSMYVGTVSNLVVPLPSGHKCIRKSEVVITYSFYSSDQIPTPLLTFESRLRPYIGSACAWTRWALSWSLTISICDVDQVSIILKLKKAKPYWAWAQASEIPSHMLNHLSHNHRKTASFRQCLDLMSSKFGTTFLALRMFWFMNVSCDCRVLSFAATCLGVSILAFICFRYGTKLS